MPGPKKFELVDMLTAFILPTLLGKCIMIYFGAHYSAEPGEGYGYGLAASALFTLTMIGRFLWKYRNYED